MGGSKKYWGFFTMQLRDYIAYPSELLANWASFPFTMVVYYFLYSMVYQYNPSFANMSFPTLITYFFLTLCFRRIGNHSGTAGAVSEKIQKGNFITNITKPIHFILYMFSFRSAKVFMQALMALPFIIIVPTLTLTNYTINPITIALALVLVLTGFVVTFQLYYIIGLLTFWLEEVWGLRHWVGLLTWLFSGAIIPVSILPFGLQSAAQILPFQHQAGIPAQLILGQTPLSQFIPSFITLLIWAVALFTIQQHVWKKGLLKHDGKG